MPYSTQRKHILIAVMAVLTLLAVIVSLAGAQESGAQTERPSTYTVQAGDTLDVLGQRWNVSVVALMLANDIKRGTDLRPGDTLIVPSDAPPYGVFPPLEDVTAGAGGGVAGDTYVVQPRDTLDTIGQRLNVSVVSLRVANDITNSRSITPGMVLIVPEGAPPYGVFPALDAETRDTTAGAGGGITGETYVVQPNDTLDTIGQRLNVSAVALRKANNITNSRALTPGTTLVIPEDAPPYGMFPPLENPASIDSTLGQGGGGNIHVVQPNETLDGIAAGYNLQARCLAEANQLLRPQVIYPGQMLVLDTTCPPYDGYDVPGTKTPGGQ